jgi:hypothetical protein
MASQPIFCGRCGNPVAHGAPFCGRCGAPQSLAIPAAPHAGPPVTYPAYSYPAAVPGSALGGVKLSRLLLAVGLIAILVVAVFGVSIYAVAKSVGSHSVCTVNCGPKTYVPLAEPNTYKSQAYKFEVDYSSDWKVRHQDAASISLGTRLGHIDVAGMKTSKTPDQVIDDAVAALPSTDWQSVQRITAVKGAHLGEVAGVGYLYSANFTGSNSTGTKVRFVVIAAVRNGVMVEVFAVNPSDTKNFASGIPEGQAFDYLLEEFRWG